MRARMLKARAKGAEIMFTKKLPKGEIGGGPGDKGNAPHDELSTTPLLKK